MNEGGKGGDVTRAVTQCRLRDTQLEEWEEVLPSPPMQPLWQCEENTDQ